MFTTGWGFHMTWFYLVKAALAWKTVRQFRLARIRLSEERGNGGSSLNLADLPQEVCNLIEEQMIISVCPEIKRQEPYRYRTSECCELELAAFFDCMQIAFMRYAASLGMAGILPGGLLHAEALRAFVHTPDFEAFTLKPWFRDHASSGDCPNMAAHVDFFKHLRLNTPHETAPVSMRSLASRNASDDQVY